jgi:hypothetical protein
LYVLHLWFVDSRQEDKWFWTEWQQGLCEFTLLLVFSWIKFWFVIVILKYLNHATFSNDILSVFMLWFCLTFWRHQHIVSFLCVYF